VTVQNWFASDADKIERVEFADGTVWNVATLNAMTAGGGGNTVPTATKLTQTDAYTEGAASVALQDIVVSDPDAGDAITATLTLALPAAGAPTTSGGGHCTSR